MNIDHLPPSVVYFDQHEKMLKMTILTRVWSAQHPNAGRNIQKPRSEPRSAGYEAASLPISYLASLSTSFKVLKKKVSQK